MSPKVRQFKQKGTRRDCTIRAVLRTLFSLKGFSDGYSEKLFPNFLRVVICLLGTYLIKKDLSLYIFTICKYMTHISSFILIYAANSNSARPRNIYSPIVMQGNKTHYIVLLYFLNVKVLCINDCLEAHNGVMGHFRGKQVKFSL